MEVHTSGNLNDKWEPGNVLASWKEVIAIPMPNPGKDPADPYVAIFL